jgi:hypothetical protein
MGEILFTLLIYLHHRYLHVLFVSHRYLQKCVYMFVLGTKNSSGHVQTNFLFGKVPNILEKFPTFCVDVIPSPLSSYGVVTLFPLPRMATFFQNTVCQLICIPHQSVGENESKSSEHTRNGMKKQASTSVSLSSPSFSID